MRHSIKKKESWNLLSIMSLLAAILFVLIALAGGVDYEKVMAEKKQEAYKMAKEKEEKIMKEIDEAFKAQSKLEITEIELQTLKEKHKAIIESSKARTILDIEKINKPRYIVEVMFRLWEKAGGTYDYVPYCIAQYESQFNTFCHNTNGENSRGLFQVNVPFHPRANPTKLFEPVYNMNYQFKELVQFEKKGISMGLDGIDLVLYVARYGQRPNWEACSEYIISEVTKTYNEFQTIKLN